MEGRAAPGPARSAPSRYDGRAMRTLAIALLLAAAARAQSGVESGCEDAARAAVPRPAVGTRSFSVPLHGDRLVLGELIEGLCGAYGLDASALDLPQAQVDLGTPAGWVILKAGERLLRGSVDFDRDLRAQRLTVTIDRERTRALRRTLRRRVAAFAERILGKDLTPLPARLSLPAAWTPDRPLAVLIHGLDGASSELAELGGFLRSNGVRDVATFDYPDDGSIEETARALSRFLKDLSARNVALVGYSMGGIIARTVVEDPSLDPGFVASVILIGTPNHGSGLAALRVAHEMAQVLQEARADFPHALGRAIAGHLRDGLGEAGGDLFPGSVFLEELDARGRNPAVRYRLVLGTRAPLSEEQRDRLRRSVGEAIGRRRLGRLLRPRVEAFVGDLDECVDGRGDGAVSVARGRLEGVEPVLVPLDHVGLVRSRGIAGARVDPAEHPVFRLVADWLREDLGG
ncbi:MAG: hypothetical protein Fur0037_17590 [Planctomycetota bacterium]